MKKFFFLILLTSCSSLKDTTNNNYKKINFNDDINFNQFKSFLIEYAKNNPYPNIDK
jgi:hypothetical protein|tara:strand:- start:2555 stop:2725 length:171 start_codon:yes stop_codon:yes gene_type:complete